MPVCTWWVRPDRSRSMRAASCGPDGFPSVSPSMTTTVSAPKTKLPAGQEAATCMAFSRAARRANSSGGSPCWISSTIWLGWTSKSKPALRNNSRRRGEAEARRKRMRWNYRRPANRVTSDCVTQTVELDSRFRGNDDVGRARREGRHSCESGNPSPGSLLLYQSRTRDSLDWPRCARLPKSISLRIPDGRSYAMEEIGIILPKVLKPQLSRLEPPVVEVLAP